MSVLVHARWLELKTDIDAIRRRPDYAENAEDSRIFRKNRAYWKKNPSVALTITTSESGRNCHGIRRLLLHRIDAHLTARQFEHTGPSEACICPYDHREETREALVIWLALTRFQAPPDSSRKCREIQTSIGPTVTANRNQKRLSAEIWRSTLLVRSTVVLFTEDESNTLTSSVASPRPDDSNSGPRSQTPSFPNSVWEREGTAEFGDEGEWCSLLTGD